MRHWQHTHGGRGCAAADAMAGEAGAPRAASSRLSQRRSSYGMRGAPPPPTEEEQAAAIEAARLQAEADERAREAEAEEALVRGQ